MFCCENQYFYEVALRQAAVQRGLGAIPSQPSQLILAETVVAAIMLATHD